MIQWLDEFDIMSEAEPSERDLHHSRLGSLTEQQVINASWRGEGLGVLAWALNRTVLPPYDRLFKAPDVADALGFIDAGAATLLSSPALRSQMEIVILAGRLLALHWRLRQFALAPAHMDFEAFAQTAYFGPLDTTGLQFVRGDLAVDGRPLAEVPVDSWRECLSLAHERQQAANWLCGQEWLYSDVSCDT